MSKLQVLSAKRNMLKGRLRGIEGIYYHPVLTPTERLILKEACTGISRVLKNWDEEWITFKREHNLTKKG